MRFFQGKTVSFSQVLARVEHLAMRFMHRKYGIGIGALNLVLARNLKE